MIKYPLSTEKSIRAMEAENKLAFIVERKSKKAEIRKHLEELFKAKIVKLNTVTTPDGKKKAYATFSADTPAIDIATKLGLM